MGPYTIRAVSLAIVLLLVVLPVCLVAWQHVASPNLWFDESGQVFLSLGSYHYAAPFTPDGGWAKIVEYSRVFNGDPGSFTAVLRYWIHTLGPSPAALRSLPFLFFLLIPIIVVLSARRFGANPVIAALAASAPLGYPMLLHYATEVRPYSMEACAVVFLFFLPCWLLDEPRNWVVIALGCAAALLVASHYSAFLFGAAACVVAAFPLRPLRPAVGRVLRFALPLAIAAVSVFLLFARYKFGTLITGDAQIAPPFQPYVLSGKDIAARFVLLRENFLAQGALPVTVFLLGAPFFIWFGPRPLTRLRALVGRTFWFAAISVTFVALASLTGKLPWSWPTRWSIGYEALAASCLAMIVITAGTTLWEASGNRRWKALLISATVCLVAAWSKQLSVALLLEHPYYETIASNLHAVASSPKAKSLRFFVQVNAMPTTRYLMELGPLKEMFSYPKNFHFETQQEANDRFPITAEDYDIIVLTHSQFSDAYRARVTNGQAEVVSILPPSTLLVMNKVFGTTSAGKTTFVNTGSDANGKLLSDGAVDRHYRYSFAKQFRYSSPTGSPVVDETAIVLASHYGWLGDDGELSHSRWLSLYGVNPPAYGSPGYYQFRTAFTITGFKLATFRLTGRWATDNDAVGIYINGHPVSFQGPPTYGTWTPVTIGPSSYFKTENILDFIVLNTLHEPNPVGMRVELTGTDAGLPPASASWVGTPPTLVVSGVTALLLSAAVLLPFGSRSRPAYFPAKESVRV